MLIKHICRLCLKNDQFSLEILSLQGEKEELKRKLQKYFNVEVSPADPFPKCICSTCLTIINEFDSLYTKFEEIQKKLLKFVQSLENTNFDNPKETSSSGNENSLISLENKGTLQEIYSADNRSKITSDNEEDSNSDTNMNGNYDSGNDKSDNNDESFPKFHKKVNKRGIWSRERSIVKRIPVGNRKRQFHIKTKSLKRKAKIRDLFDFECLECGISQLKKFSELEIHYKDLHKHAEINVICKKCGQTLNKRDQLIAHLSQHKQICKSSNWNIKTQKSKQINKAFISEFYEFACLQCLKNNSNIKFSNYFQLANHCKIEHNSQALVECKKCGKRSGSRRMFMEHIKRHTQPQLKQKELDPLTILTSRFSHKMDVCEQLAKFYSLHCDICNDSKIYPSFTKLSKHYRKEHNRPGYVICCGRRWAEASIKTHMIKHLQPEMYTCKVCNKRLASKRILDSHMMCHVPENERPHKCEKCGRGYSSEGGLKLHLALHLPDNERQKFMCDQCGKSFSSRGSLNTHKKAIHVQNFPAVCDICAKAFHSRHLLTAHIARVHSTQRLQCETCGIWLKNESSLNNHMKKHSGNEFPCLQCNKVYNLPESLRSHMKFHNEAKPHQCNICLKSFKLKSTLKTHSVQHTGEKPFACQFCLKTFASGGNYYAHRKRMHPQQQKELALRKAVNPWTEENIQ